MSVRLAGGPLACVICVAAAQACSSSSEQAGAGPDASADASTATDAAGIPDAGYPPLKFADIGAAVPISTQFYFTEGPVWDPKKSVLYFTDINAHQGATVGGAIYRLTLPNTFDVLLQPAGNADGIGLDPQGNIIAAGFLSRDVWRLSSTNTMQILAPCSQDGGTVAGSDAETDGEADGARDGETGAATDGEVDAASDGATDAAMDGGGDAATDGGVDGATDGATDDGATGGGTDDGAVDGATGGGTDGAISSTADSGPSSATSGGTCYEGQEINTPDDITSRSDGVLYFTDPTFASDTQGFPTLTLPLSGAQGVYRLTTDGVLHLEDSTTNGPNGVNLSPDEKTLYVAYTLTGEVAKFDVAADGSLSGKTTFATGATIADSMCVDAGGNVYVGTVSGLAVYNPAGQHLGTISVGGLIVTNCAFGGTDQRTLFITARTQATLSGAPPMGGGALYQIASMPVPGIPGQN
jgi:sugar lactone lactonase YvrE